MGRSIELDPDGERLTFEMNIPDMIVSVQNAPSLIVNEKRR
jgi:hypothetical protein